MANWLDKYNTGNVAKTDATRVAAPALKLTKKQLEENRKINAQVMAKTNKAKAEEVAKRAAAKNKPGKSISEVFTSKEPYNIQERFRLFPNDTEYGQVFDEYFNPAYFTAQMASNLGNTLQTGDYKGAAMTAGMALGAGALGFDPLGSVMKVPGKLDKVIYPTRTYRASLAEGARPPIYGQSELADKVLAKGDWSTKDLGEAFEYLRGIEGGRPGLLTGQNMNLTEYKVPFWKKSVAADKDVVALKALQGDVPNPNEYIIPDNKFLYPRRTNLLQAAPENVKNATFITPLGEEFRYYRPESIPMGFSSEQYRSPAYKYVEDQLNAVTGHEAPFTHTLEQEVTNNIPMSNWQQLQFAPNAGIGKFKRFENGGWLDKYNDGGEVKDPKKKPLVNLRDATITSEDLEYLNSPASGYCPKGNCLENTRKGYDMTAGRLPGIPTSSNIWSNDLKAFSTASSPTEEQINAYPYLMGDKSSGSADSWDIQGLIVDSGGKNIYSAQPNQIIPTNVPLGAVYGWGPAGTTKSNRNSTQAGYNQKFNLQPSHHSTQSVGWNEKGEPILYDGHFGKYGTFTEISNLLKNTLGYELENIGVPKSIANNTRENLSKKGILKTEITPYNVDINKLLEATKQPWAKIKEDGKLRVAKADKKQLSEFAQSLIDNKGLLVSSLGISNSEYDRLADSALAIAMTESEGGGALGGFDMFGSTQGMTQLNADNIMKDDRLKSARTKRYTKNSTIGGNQSIRNPHNSAIATMMYLSVANKDASRLFEQGLKPGVRAFEEPGFIENFRSTNSRLNKDGIFIDELNKRIPYSQIPGYEDEDVNKINNYLKKLTKSDKYSFVNKDGDLSLNMKTKGNNPKLTDIEKIAYMWQSPNSLKTGDAEGKSEYVNKIKNYYESLRKHKNGAELNANNSNVSFPPNYVGQGYDITGRDYSPAWGGQFKHGGILDLFKGKFAKFKETLPPNLRDTPNRDYDMRYFWKHSGKPQNFEAAQAMDEPMFSLEEDGYHAPSVEPTTGRFLKPKHHSTLYKELEWYNSEDPNAVEFRKTHDLDTTGKYYQYVPKQFDNGGDLSFIDNPKLRNMLEGYKPGFMDINDYRLPQGQIIPLKDPSSEVSTSIGGGDGYPAYLVPSFKYAAPLRDPEAEFNMTGQYLGGPFKTVEDAERYREIRHDFIDKEYKTLPSPIATSNMAMGGSLPGATGFMYARTGAPSKGPRRNQTSVTDASAQNGKEVEKDIKTVDVGMLPEITVVGSKDPQTEEFYRSIIDKLPRDEDLGIYEGMMDLGKKYGFPKVHPIDKNSIAAKLHTMLEPFERRDKYPANYDPATETIQANNWEDWISEMAHHKQFKNNRLSKFFQTLTNDLPAVVLRKDAYKTPGTIEYEAHDIIEPELWKEMKTSSDNYYYDPYISKKRKEHADDRRHFAFQNGGEMKYYQNGLDFKPKSISKNGSVIKDDRGQWAHPGKITEIGSNKITMQGVPYPVLGISDTGDVQMMYPNQDYIYHGSSVTEYPMMKQGGQLTKLDQLTNFTNYNTKQPGGWLDKYQD